MNNKLQILTSNHYIHVYWFENNRMLKLILLKVKNVTINSLFCSSNVQKLTHWNSLWIVRVYVLNFVLLPSTHNRTSLFIKLLKAFKDQEATFSIRLVMTLHTETNIYSLLFHTCLESKAFVYPLYLKWSLWNNNEVI